MDSPHDVQFTHVAPADTVASSHSDLPLAPLPPTSMSQQPAALFSDDLDHDRTMSVPMDVSIPSMSAPMDVTSMSALASAAPSEATPTASMGNFASSLNGFLPPETHADILPPVQSSPGAASVSSYPSHASSPAIPGLNPAFSVTPSSIASALDNIPVSIGRNRSDSSASPAYFMASAADIGFPSAGSGPPTSSHSSSFQFPPSDFDGSPAEKEESPEIPGGPHLMVVGDMLRNIMQTANSARQACSMGQGLTAGVKIDELKKTIALVSELIAATRLVDGPSPPRESVSPQRQGGSPSHPSTAGAGVSLSLRSVDPHGHEIANVVDLTESRKRCASSMAGDRVIKALKLEPQEDLSLHPHFSFPSSGDPMDPHSMPSYSSSSPSAPSSRPASSAGLSLHHMYPPQQISHSMSLNFAPPPLNLSSAPPRQSMDYSPPQSAPPSHASHIQGHVPGFGHPPDASGSWTSAASVFPHQRHHHSMSGTSLSNGLSVNDLIMGSAPSFPSGTPFASSPPLQSAPSSSASAINPSLRQDVTRLSRSSSVSNPSGDPFAFSLPDVPLDDRMDYRPSRGSRPSTAVSQSPGGSSEYDNDDRDSDAGGEPSQSPPSRSGTFRGRMGSLDNGPAGSPYQRPSTSQRRSLASRPSMENFSAMSSLGHGNEVPSEYRAEVDRIFFDFLNKICSNLEATDAKGEPIHQTLMAKKMQRLDESPDFRPFKFRIQAFTNAFLEELARQGYPEDKIPMKKIRNYLWNSSYISRFNEDGKKAKSKGNHIWNIEAKKASEGGWIFRPFYRRLAGLPPGVAYVGLRWSWTPRIWDPQASRNNMPVEYSSPSLPAWLSWKDDVLAGIPPHDAQSCDVVVEARFIQDGQEEFLSQSVHINIAPMSNVDSTFTPSQRPSLNGTDLSPRRIVSDSIVPQAVPVRSAVAMRAQASLPQSTVVPSQDAQVIQVLTTAAQRVAQEAQSQVIGSRITSEPGPELQSLAKQQHVLTVTAQAVDSTVSGSSSTQPSSVLAAAAQQVVLQAARQVAADRSNAAAAQISAGLTPSSSISPQVTVNEVSVATQSAVAQAVELAGPLSSEVDVLMTASSLLQQQSRAPAPGAPQLAPPMDHARPHSTGTLIARSTFNGLPSGAAVPSEAGMFAAAPGTADFVPFLQHS